jgi:hypothetical protein
MNLIILIQLHLIYTILYNKQNNINFLVQNGDNLEHKDFFGNSALNLSFKRIKK